MTLGGSRTFPDIHSALSDEFVTTSGSGAYASATLCGAPTRRYHALLGAPLEGAGGMHVFLSGLEEVLIVGGARLFLSTREFPGTVFPEGYRHIKSFEMDPLPEFVFEVGGVAVRKTIALAPEEATVVVSYELLGGGEDVSIEIRPLASFRGRHALSAENSTADLAVTTKRGWVHFKPFEKLPALRFRFPGAFTSAPTWYRNAEYRREKERRHDSHEDLLSPGYATTRLKEGKPARFVATLENNTGRASSLVKAAEAANLEWSSGMRRLGSFAHVLSIGMRDFLVRHGAEAGVLRGLPWHSQWSRHSMMALTGLAAIGKVAEVQDVLSAWAARAENGLLPLYLDDHGRPQGADVEGTLWFFEAVNCLLSRTKNYEWVRSAVEDFMRHALDTLKEGTSGAAEMSGDGLLLTDASSRPLAPRGGGPVALTEVQALYFNALRVAEDIASHFRDEETAKSYDRAARDVHSSFNGLMWNSDHHVPVDSLGETADLTTRPMCLFSVSLSYPVLVRRRWEILIDQVDSALLTPLGLMAVPMDFPGSKSYFPGDSYEDARRSGGIWPEFLGAYLAAHARTFGTLPEHSEWTKDYFEPLESSLAKGLWFHLPEFFDSIEPFTPRGAQANAAASGQILWALTTKVEPRHYGGEG